jgi:hypothetical protein
MCHNFDKWHPVSLTKYILIIQTTEKVRGGNRQTKIKKVFTKFFL